MPVSGECGLSGILCAFLAAFGLQVEQALAAIDDLFGDDVLSALLLVGQAIHQVQHDLLDHGPQSPVARVAL